MFWRYAGRPSKSTMRKVEFYTYDSAEHAEAQAFFVADLGNPEDEPQFDKLGSMLVRDLLEDVLGATAAGQ